VGNPGHNIGSFLEPVIAGEAYVFDAGLGTLVLTIANGRQRGHRCRQRLPVREP
jgi:hypothetical protein